MSALLLILCTEILAIAIRQNVKIKEINQNNSDAVIKITKYADAGSLFLNDENEMEEAILQVKIWYCCWNRVGS